MKMTNKLSMPIYYNERIVNPGESVEVKLEDVKSLELLGFESPKPKKAKKQEAKGEDE